VVKEGRAFPTEVWLTDCSECPIDKIS